MGKGVKKASFVGEPRSWSALIEGRSAGEIERKTEPPYRDAGGRSSCSRTGLGIPTSLIGGLISRDLTQDSTRQALSVVSRGWRNSVRWGQAGIFFRSRINFLPHTVSTWTSPSSTVRSLHCEFDAEVLVQLQIEHLATLLSDRTNMTV